MAVELTPFGKVVVGTIKWIVIPVAVGFIGMKFIGPNIGGAPSLTPRKEHKSSLAPPSSEHARKFQQIREANP